MSRYEGIGGGDPRNGAFGSVHVMQTECGVCRPNEEALEDRTVLHECSSDAAVV